MHCRSGLVKMCYLQPVARCRKWNWYENLRRIQNPYCYLYTCNSKPAISLMVWKKTIIFVGIHNHQFQEIILMVFDLQGIWCF